MTGRFAGRHVLVTGAASGIGRATALRLGRDGADVSCLDLAQDGAEATAATVRQSGGRARAYGCDVSDHSSVQRAVESAVADGGAPSVLCNIAGIGRFAHSAQQPPGEWQRIIAVNLTGTFLMSQACLPHLLARGGVIVNTASTAGVIAQPYSAAYCASKGGVVMLTKAMAYEYIDRGVRINAVAPGGIETPIMESFAYPEDADGRLFHRMMSPMGFAQPDEVASLFAFVASDEASYMTGAVVTYDGGLTC